MSSRVECGGVHRNRCVVFIHFGEKLPLSMYLSGLLSDAKRCEECNKFRLEWEKGSPSCRLLSAYLFIWWLSRLLPYTPPSTSFGCIINSYVYKHHDTWGNVEWSECTVQDVSDVLRELEVDERKRKINEVPLSYQDFVSFLHLVRLSATTEVTWRSDYAGNVTRGIKETLGFRPWLICFSFKVWLIFLIEFGAFLQSFLVLFHPRKGLITQNLRLFVENTSFKKVKNSNLKNQTFRNIRRKLTISAIKINSISKDLKKHDNLNFFQGVNFE